MYSRINSSVFFIIPALAIGIDVDGRYFIEAAWLCFAVGLGDKP